MRNDGPAWDSGCHGAGTVRGEAVIDNYARRVLAGVNFRGVAHQTNKLLRAGPVSSAAEAGNLKLVKGNWIGQFLLD